VTQSEPGFNSWLAEALAEVGIGDVILGIGVVFEVEIYNSLIVMLAEVGI